MLEMVIFVTSVRYLYIIILVHVCIWSLITVDISDLKKHLFLRIYSLDLLL